MARPKLSKSGLPRTRRKTRGGEQEPAIFSSRHGRRYAGAALSAVICVMFLIHQTQIEGTKPLLRVLALAISFGTGALAWYLLRKAMRRGTLLRLDDSGIWLALGLSGGVTVPWDAVRGYRYWEPTGLAMLYKRRQPRWVGVWLKDERMLDGLPWHQRIEVWLNKLAGRPGLAILHPYVDRSILEVLEAFQTRRPDLDDPMAERT